MKIQMKWLETTKNVQEYVFITIKKTFYTSLDDLECGILRFEFKLNHFIMIWKNLKRNH
jgi:hypothetical protein